MYDAEDAYGSLLDEIRLSKVAKKEAGLTSRMEAPLSSSFS